MIKTIQENQPQAAEDLIEVIELSDEETDLVGGGPEVENDPNTTIN